MTLRKAVEVRIVEGKSQQGEARSGGAVNNFFGDSGLLKEEER